MFRRVAFLSLVATSVWSGAAALAGGSVACDGVAGSHDFFRSASWDAFYGTQGRPGELIVTNNTNATIFFQYWSDAPSTDWSNIGPKSNRTFPIDNDATVTRMQCGLAEGTAPPPVAAAQPPHPALAPRPTTTSFAPAPQASPVIADPQADPVIPDPQLVEFPVSDPVVDPQTVPVPSQQPGSGGGKFFPHPYADPASVTLPSLPDQGNAAPVDPDDFGGVVVDVAPEDSTRGVLSEDLAAQIMLLKQ